MDACTWLLSSWRVRVLGLFVVAGVGGCGAHVPPPREAASAPAVVGPVAVHPSPTAPMAPAPPEVEKERHDTLVLLDAAFQRHDQEPLAPEWSPRATASMRADLERIRQVKPFTLLEVGCRSNSCKAVLEWPDYPRAVDAAEALAHQPFALNCARAVLMPQPAELAQPYRLRILFQCS